MRKKLTSMLVCLLLLGGIGVGSVAAAVPAAAAGACGGSCNFKDPQSTGCAGDARTIDSFVYYGSESALYGALLELRYSPSCYAAWARVTGGSCNSYVPPYCAVVIEGSTNRSSIAEWTSTNADGGQNWTFMLDFTYWTRACFVNFVPFSGNYSRVACTAWH